MACMLPRELFCPKCGWSGVIFVGDAIAGTWPGIDCPHCGKPLIEDNRITRMPIRLANRLWNWFRSRI
jgi:predicted RNA-binding Zn-ribbon protein involved in translation (DUF1610 family)